MSKKKKYYVVWGGYETGVFDTWSECQNMIQGYPNASYKSFPDRDSAIEAFYGGPGNYIGKSGGKKELSRDEKERFGEPIKNSLAVDAACSGNPGIMEYQGVMVSTNEKIFQEGPFQEGTVNIGEFLAIVHGLAYLKTQNSNIPIYTDSRTALAWVRNKKANTTLQKISENQKLLELIERAEHWLKINQWENKLLKWDTENWDEIPADFGRK